VPQDLGPPDDGYVAVATLDDDFDMDAPADAVVQDSTSVLAIVAMLCRRDDPRR
jgi:hypothetical protein